MPRIEEAIEHALGNDAQKQVSRVVLLCGGLSASGIGGMDVLAKTVNFALRLPPEMKAAAEALKSVNMFRPSRCGSDGYPTLVKTDTVNATLCSLILEGLEPVLGYLHKQLDLITEAQAAWQEIWKFLLENSTASCAKESDFADGSVATTLIAFCQYYDEDAKGLGLDRKEVARHYASDQGRLLRVMRAKIAILNVLGPLEARARESAQRACLGWPEGIIECNECMRLFDAEQVRQELCPDCADGMIECIRCGRLFHPEQDGRELCLGCVDNEFIPSRVPAVEQWAAEIAALHYTAQQLGVLDRAAAEAHAEELAQSGFTRFAPWGRGGYYFGEEGEGYDFDPEEWKAACVDALLKLAGTA
jgi:hypothetical protein